MARISRERSQRILITGGAGFIGSHLAQTLLEEGHQVAIIDDLSTGRIENIRPLIDRWAHQGYPSAFRYAIDSVGNAAVLDRLLSESDLVVHLAAAVGVRLIVESPIETIERNVLGTELVLRTALRYRTKVLIASTSEVYGKGTRVPFREDDDVVLGPTVRNRWAYAGSKMLDEFLALAYHREKGLPVVIFRLFNTVGPRQTGRYGMVIPRLVTQALKGEPLTVFGDGKQSRCFLHVADAVRAIIAMSTTPAAIGQVINIGSTEEISILALARRILALARPAGARAARRSRGRSSGTGVGPITFVPYEKAYRDGFEDMQRRVPDVAKARKLIGWQPRIDIDETLRDVIASVRRDKLD